MPNRSELKNELDIVINRTVDLARNPGAPSRISGAASGGASGTPSSGNVGLLPGVGAPGVGAATEGHVTRPIEVGGVISTAHVFMLGYDELDDSLVYLG